MNQPKITVLLAILLFAHSAAYADLSNQSDAAAISKAISTNDVAALKKVVDSGFGGREYECILSSVLAWEASDKVCRDSIVNYLLEKGADPTEYLIKVEKSFLGGGVICTRSSDLSNAVASLCPDVINLLSSKLSEKERSYWLGRIWTNSEIHIPAQSETPSPTNSALRKRAFDTITLLKRDLTDECTLKGQMNNGCQDNAIANALASLANEERRDAESIHRSDEDKKIRADRQTEEAEQKKKEARQVKYASSPEGIKKQACEDVKTIRLLDSQLEREKKVEQASGIVNMSAKYELGQAKVDTEQALESLKEKYRQVAKKEPNLSDCK